MPPLLDEPFPHLSEIELELDGPARDWADPRWHTAAAAHETFLDRLLASLSASASATLERLRIHTAHLDSAQFCQALFGAGDATVGQDDFTVRSRFPKLALLAVCPRGAPGRGRHLDTCAAYLASALPSLRDVLVLLDGDGRRVELPGAD